MPTESTSPPAAPAAVPTQRTNRRRLGEVLVGSGLLTAEQLAAALDAQAELGSRGRRRRLGEILLRQGVLDERRLAMALAEALGLDIVEPGLVPLDMEAARLLPRPVCERHGIVVIGRTANGLRVAAADPTDVVAVDDVRLYSGVADVTVMVATESQVRHLIARIWSLAESSTDVAMMLDGFDAAEQGDDGDAPDVGDAPIVRLVNDIYADAVRLGASDIHVEPQPTELRIRYRIDGLLRDVMTVPKRAAAAVVSRIKVTSGVDIAERRRPQDGRTRLAFEGRTVDARVSTLPTVYGEKVVVRLLTGADDVPPLTRLGLTDKQRETLLTRLLSPQGLVLITGPTGSGKTNTLYSAIRQIRTPDRNIVTLEDPVEVQLAGISQVQVHERSGLTFARGLRAILRQDPDVVLLGEVRDAETAELALRASLTGHLVLTTLHTNDAVSALTRLVDMGVEPFLVASSLAMVVGQRLVRTPCADCAAPYTPNSRTLALLGLGEGDLAGATPVRGRGCSECGGTGYRGRTGIFEVLPVTAAVRRVLLSSPSEAALRAAARGVGMQTLRAAGLRKAHAGETTYEEILRVTHVDTAETGSCRVCERGLAEDMVVCPWCTAPVDRGHCPGCARPLDPEWRICPWCRTPTPHTGDAAPGGDAPTRLLVVDDDPSVRAVLSAALADTFAVDVAGSAEEALAALARTPYDGLVLDQLLPDLTGIEVIRLLRGDPATATLPVVLLTGSATAGTEASAIAAGADAYFAKPVEPELLEARLAALCAGDRPRA